MGIVLGYSLLSLVNSCLPAVLNSFVNQGCGSGCRIFGSDLRKRGGSDPQEKLDPDPTL